MRDINRFHSLIAFVPHEEYLEKWNNLYLPIEFKKGDVLIDVGAHIGRVSIPFAKKGFQVFSYEPDPENFECLKKNIKDNQVKAKVFNNAVHKDGILKFRQDPRTTMGAVSEDGVKVDGISLERIFKDNKIMKCKLLKMDCEGSEYEIFENLPEKIWERIENLIVEVHPFEGKPETFISDLIRSHGFEVNRSGRRGEFFELFCTRNI